MSHYVVIHSDKSQTYFPENTTVHFRSQFQSPLNLKGVWKVALVDIALPPSTSKTKQNIYVHSDVCGETFVDGEKENLLRVVRAPRV